MRLSAKVRKNDENEKKPLFYRRLFLYSARRVLWEAVRFIMHEDFFGKSRAGGALESGFSGPARI